MSFCRSETQKRTRTSKNGATTPREKRTSQRSLSPRGPRRIDSSRALLFGRVKGWGGRCETWALVDWHRKEQRQHGRPERWSRNHHNIRVLEHAIVALERPAGAGGSGESHKAGARAGQEERAQEIPKPMRRGHGDSQFALRYATGRWLDKAFATRSYRL